MKKTKAYRVQTIHAIICPDGSAYDYYQNKKEAIKQANRLNAAYNEGKRK